MIVCHCHAVTDREIRTAVRDGASSVGCVARRSGATTGCGGCSELVEDIVDDELAAAGARRGLPVLTTRASLSR